MEEAEEDPTRDMEDPPDQPRIQEVPLAKQGWSAVFAMYVYIYVYVYMYPSSLFAVSTASACSRGSVPCEMLGAVSSGNHAVAKRCDG